MQASQDAEDASRDEARPCLQVVRVADGGPPEGQQHTLNNLASSTHVPGSDKLKTCCTHGVPVKQVYGEASAHGAQNNFGRSLAADGPVTRPDQLSSSQTLSGCWRTGRLTAQKGRQGCLDELAAKQGWLTMQMAALT